MPRAVVWDLDGTLIDSAPDLADALNILLREHGREERRPEDVRDMIGGGVAALIERGFGRNASALTQSGAQSLVNRFMEIYRDRAILKTRLYEDAMQILQALSGNGIIHGICTNKPRGVSMDIIAGLGIADRFGSVIGGDSTRAKKPDAIPLLACLEQLAVDENEAVMIGDSAADVGAARAAGLPVVLVTYGYSREPVASLGADALADRLDQIPSLLRELG